MKNNVEKQKKKPSLLKTLFDKSFLKKQKTQKNDEPKKLKAPFKVLLCITFASYGERITEIFKQRDIQMSMVVKGYGTAESSMMEILGIKETERDIVLGLVKSENTKNLVSEMITEFDKNKLKGTFCALLSPSSASMEMLNLLNLIGVENND